MGLRLLVTGPALRFRSSRRVFPVARIENTRRTRHRSRSAHRLADRISACARCFPRAAGRLSSPNLLQHLPRRTARRLARVAVRPRQIPSRPTGPTRSSPPVRSTARCIAQAQPAPTRARQQPEEPARVLHGLTHADGPCPAQLRPAAAARRATSARSDYTGCVHARGTTQRDAASVAKARGSRTSSPVHPGALPPGHLGGADRRRKDPRAAVTGPELRAGTSTARSGGDRLDLAANFAFAGKTGTTVWGPRETSNRLG